MEGEYNEKAKSNLLNDLIMGILFFSSIEVARGVGLPSVVYGRNALFSGKVRCKSRERIQS